MPALTQAAQASHQPRPPAVVPIGGQAFIAPRVRPRDPSDELARRASFAAMRAHRHSWGDSLSAGSLATNAQPHRRSTSTCSATVPMHHSRRMRTFHLVLPPEAQKRLDAWQTSLHPAFSPASETAAEGAEARRAPVASSVPSCGPDSLTTQAPSSGSNCPSPAQSGGRASPSAVAQRRMLRGRTPFAACPRKPSTADAVTPELASSRSSLSDNQTAVHTPCSAHLRPSGETLDTVPGLGAAVGMGPDWVARQDEYAGRMYAFTEQMWSRERKHRERSAASGQKRTEPQTAREQTELARRRQLAQAQRAREAQAQAQAAAAAPPQPLSALLPFRGKPRGSASESSPHVVDSGDSSLNDWNSPARWSRFLRRLFA